MTPSFKVAIPARYGSSRLPGKPLRQLAGQTMIERVYRQALASGADEVVVATDDPRIEAAVTAFGGTVCMTAVSHRSGTDRLAEVVAQRHWSDDTVVVNVQGDEPLLPPALIRQVAADLIEKPKAGIATAATPIIDSEELFAPQAVKVVLNQDGYALYFSRAPIPFHRDRFAIDRTLPTDTGYLRHIGLYAYRAGVLRQYPQLSVCAIAQAEALEQLRAMWHGIGIYVRIVDQPPPAGVDTEVDLIRIATLLEKGT